MSIDKSLVDMEVRLENLPEVVEAFKQFPVDMKNTMFRSLQISSNREEKILKSTTGFRDRTGHLRSTMAVVARYRPIGIDVDIFARYAKYVAHAHGTWRPRWWYEFVAGFMERIPRGISSALERAVKKFNRETEE